MPSKSNGRTRVPNDQFVKVWATAVKKDLTLIDIVEATGLSYGGVTAKAKTLREAGVKLPKLRRASRAIPIDVKGLNALLG